MRSESAMRGRRMEESPSKETTRRPFPQVNPGVVGLAGLEPAASSLSEMDGRALRYPAFLLVVQLRKWHRDGVNLGPDPAFSAGQPTRVVHG